MPSTIRGRVVYQRKRHVFTWCDLRRIVSKVDAPRTEYQRYCKLLMEREVLAEVLGMVPSDDVECFSRILSAVDAAIADMRESGVDPAFSGGDYGGGGASRGIFENPLKWP